MHRPAPAQPLLFEPGTELGCERLGGGHVRARRPTFRPRVSNDTLEALRRGAGVHRLRAMSPPEGRAPHPKGGDPNVKMIRLSLTPGEWRKLRVWAAMEDSSMSRRQEGG